MEGNKEELTEEEKMILRNHGEKVFDRWKRYEEKQEWYGRKLYIFNYYDLYEYDDEVHYHRISLIDKTEEEARKRAIEIFEKEKYKMEDNFTEPLKLEFVIDAEYVKFLPAEYFGITEWY